MSKTKYGQPQREYAEMELDLQEKNAWLRYLAQCKHLQGPKYEAAESWAWAQLIEDLGKISARRAKL